MSTHTLMAGKSPREKSWREVQIDDMGINFYKGEACIQAKWPNRD